MNTTNTTSQPSPLLVARDKLLDMLDVIYNLDINEDPKKQNLIFKRAETMARVANAASKNQENHRLSNPCDNVRQIPLPNAVSNDTQAAPTDDTTSPDDDCRNT